MDRSRSIDALVRSFSRAARIEPDIPEETYFICQTEVERLCDERFKKGIPSATIADFTKLLGTYSLPMVIKDHDSYIDLCMQAGFYLTALISHAREREVRVELGGMDYMPFFCYKLVNKHVEVTGELGGSAGEGMLRSELIITGGAGDFAGKDMNDSKFMASGRVDDFAGMGMRNSILNVGCAGNYLCKKMKGGTAHAKSAGREVAKDMESGEIHLEEYCCISENAKGKIYCNGNLVHPKGRNS